MKVGEHTFMKKLICIMLLLLLIACKNKVQEEESKLIKCTTIQTINNGEYGYKINGTCTNNSETEFENAEVVYECYDNNNNNLGTAVDFIEDLSAKKTVEFEAVFFGDASNVKECKFSEISPYNLSKN
jgi:hypothetical protein